MNFQNEPTLSQIDDYSGNESKEKRKIIYSVVFGLLVVGGIYTFFKSHYSHVSDYIGTKANPGLDGSCK